jgi:hypothetical protein
VPILASIGKRVCKIGAGRAEVTSEPVQSVASDKDARGNIQFAIVSVELAYGCTASSGITLAEDLLKVPIKKFHNSLSQVHFSYSSIP